MDGKNGKARTVTVRELELAMPAIRWRQPLRAVYKRVPYLLCRVCIMQRGIKRGEVPYIGFITEDDFLKHMEENHP